MSFPMKLRLLFSALILAAAGVCYAAWTKQSSRVVRLQADTTFTSNTSGTATAVKVTAYLQALITDDADPTKARGHNDWVPVSFDLLAAPVSTTNYTAAGKTVNGTQLAALLREVALQEATRQNVSP